MTDITTGANAGAAAPVTVVPSIVTSLIKTYAQKLLTTAAAAVGFTGVEQGQVAQMGVGVILGIVSIAWAYVDEKLAHQRLIAAVVAPAAIPVTKLPTAPPVA